MQRGKQGLERGINKHGEGVKAPRDLKEEKSLGLFLKVKCGFIKQGRKD